MRDAHDAITIQDLDGRILAWNPGAVRMYGFSEPEALAMNINALVPDARKAEAALAMRRLLRSEILEPYRTQRIAKNGRTVEISLTVTALVNQAGEVYALATTERGIP
jgi:two-component system CheB/CheR fusion protein